MFEIYLCIRDQHDPWLVVVAAIICIVSTQSAALLLRQAQLSKARARMKWLATAGITTGFGIWATHFVAMLGYDPGVVAGYHLGLTAASLAIAVAMTTAGFFVMQRTGRAVVASVMVGGGIATMHYTGMAAVELPGTLRWDYSFVIASVLLAIAPIIPSLKIITEGRKLGSGVAGGLLMTVAIVLLHFTGMAGIEVLPWDSGHLAGALLSPTAMSAWIGAVAIGLIVVSVVAVVISRRTANAIHASERNFSLLAKGISDCAIYMLTRDGDVASWNAGAERLKGYTAEEAIGLSLGDFYTPEDWAAGLHENALAVAAATGKYTGEGWRLRRDGTRFWAHVTIEDVRDEAGTRIGFAKITRDMTRLKQDQDRLAAIRNQLDTALDNMHQGLCLFDAEDRLVLRNRRFLELWNLNPGDCMPGTSLDDVASMALYSRTQAPVPKERLDNMRLMLNASLADPKSAPIISEFDEHFTVSVASRPLPGGGWVSTFEDITERRRSEAKIAHMAHHDLLTGLPNRVRFGAWVDAEMAHAREEACRFAVIAIDLDRFKEINDSRGHAAGDQALQMLAGRLLEKMGEREVVARLGGDEFAAAKTFHDDAELDDFIARIEECFAHPMGEGENAFVLGASIGVAIYPTDGETREQILNNADLAMYRAKTSIAQTVCYYEPGMDENARARRQLANDLRQAIDRGEFRLLYQIQRSLKTGAVSGYEALLRWYHPLRGSVSPTDFIPIAEETGEIFGIGEWVLRQACHEAARWEEPHKVAVNLSPIQLMQPDLPRMVGQILLESGLSPKRLELEITETAIISDKARALHVLRQIKALGVSIAMDDFGTGYSSLDTLHSFPFDKIKIDKSFLLRSEASPQARAIVRAVLALGRSLEVPVLAEGVETEAHVKLLQSEGCDEVQGYFFGRPAEAPSGQEEVSEIAKAS